jgi:hypothetical protein
MPQCCPNWSRIATSGQAKPLIPHTRRQSSKSRLACFFRCCPNCGPAIGAPFLCQNSFERPAGRPFKTLALTAWLNRWRFAVQIGFSENLIWTRVGLARPAYRQAPRHIDHDRNRDAGASWGRLLTCAAVGNRRWTPQPWQLADCQSAAGCHPAPHRSRDRQGAVRRIRHYTTRSKI